MSKKGKGAVLDYQGVGVAVYEDSKSRLKHHNLMQEYNDLQKDTDGMRNKLETAKQKKLLLSAEIRFLRRRYTYLVESKTMNISQGLKVMYPPPNPVKQTKNSKEQLMIRNEASQFRLPPLVPELKSKKRRYIGKEVTLPGTPSVMDKPLKKTLHGRKETIKQRTYPVSVLNHKGRINMNQKDRMHGYDFDLNQDSSPVENGASLLTRAPNFDLNEISTGDEDFQGNVEAVNFEETTKKSIIRGLNDEQQNDLKLSLCRNAGESSSRVGKRKISWQDPVALRV